MASKSDTSSLQPTPTTTGQALFFWFPPRSTELYLLKSQIFKRRVSYPDFTTIHPAGPSINHPIFIESRNLNKTPNQLRGVTVAYRHIQYKGDASASFLFAIVYKVDYERDLMIAFQLNSQMKIDDFYNLKGHELKDSFLEHFHQVNILLSTIQVYWLNQVSGKCLPLSSGYSQDVIGPDGKFQCSLLGPDVIILHMEATTRVQIPPLEEYPKLPDYRRISEDMRRQIPSMRFIRNRKRKEHDTNLPDWLYPKTNRCYDGVVSNVVYVRQGSHTDVEKGSNEVYAVPFLQDPPSNRVVFANILSSQVTELYKINGQFSILDFNKFLEQLMVSKFEVLLFVPSTKPLQFRIVPAWLWDRLKHQPDIRVPEGYNGHDLLCGEYVESNNLSLLHGYNVSFWHVDPHLHAFQVTWTDTLRVRSTYGTGFGSRLIAKCEGTNIYLGPRGSSRSRPTPAESPGVAPFSQYFRQHYDSRYQPLIEKSLHALSDKIQSLPKSVDNGLVAFIDPKNDLNVNLICTQGCIGSSMGFCNGLHVDHRDRITNLQQIEFLEKEIKRVKLLGLPSDKSLIVDYVWDFHKVIGWGAMTTCGYQYVFHTPPTAKADMVSETCGARHLQRLKECAKEIVQNEGKWEYLMYGIDRSEADSYLLKRLTLKISPRNPSEENKPKVYAYFVNNGLGTCVTIEDYSSHYFYGHAFSHQTAFPLMVKNGKVFTTCNNDNDSESSGFNLFAWGKGKRNTSGGRGGSGAYVSEVETAPIT